jgi:hypothetical protein
MENLEKQINQIVSKELESLSELPPLHSVHEGCAFLMGEVEEARNDLEILGDKMIALWKKTKAHSPIYDLKYEANIIEALAINLAESSCKVAVKAREFVSFLETREGEKNDES